MKAAVLSETGFVFEERKLPECGSDQILVRTAGCGVCEGDVFQYVTRMGDPECKQEFIHMGHEGSGVVAAVGTNVREFKKGDPVPAILGSTVNRVRGFVARGGYLMGLETTIPRELPDTVRGGVGRGGNRQD